MTSFLPNPESFASLKGKVVVLTGGANGIGAAAVKLYSESGANVVFGDIDSAKGISIAASFPENVHFVKTDVTSYEDILALFEKAYKTYSRVDIAVSNAGLVELPGWFDAKLDLESVRKAPTSKVLDVNLLGTIQFAHIAAVYLRQNASPKDDKSLTLLSSVAGFEESPGLFVYQATKHGVIGLMRSLRLYLPGAYGGVKIRVNCVCPWATRTAMIQTFQEAWEKEGIPMNSPEELGEIIVGISADENLHGESIFVEGGRSWAFEKNLAKLQPQWLGESAAANLRTGQAFLGGGGSKWSK